MSRRWVIALVAAAVGVAAGVSGAARAGYVGADGAISYTQGGTIYSIEAGKRSVLAAPAAGHGLSRAVWSPDGHMIVFVDDRFADHEGGQDYYTLHTLDVRTGQNRQVVPNATAAWWSPDGTKLGYICQSGICVVGLDGRLQWTAPVAPGAYVTEFAWSPDGRLGYVALTPDGKQRVWVSASDGSNPHPVSPDETWAFGFAWSPDGKRIAYIGDHGLVVMDSDGNNARSVDPGGRQFPSWSPNGQSLIYTGRVGTTFDMGLVTINVDGTNRHELVDPSSNAYLNSASFPDWQRLPALPALVAEPSVTGTARVGKSLTAAPGSWSGDTPQTYTYRWQRCSPACADLAETSSTYTVTKADAGSRLRVVVSARNVAGSASTASNQTALVPEPSFAAVRGKRIARTVHLSFTVCDDSPTAVVVSETDWTLVHGTRRDVQRHSWLAGTGPGCHSASRAWPVVTRGSRTLVVVARDGDGVSTKSLRLTLR